MSGDSQSTVPVSIGSPDRIVGRFRSHSRRTHAQHPLVRRAVQQPTGLLTEHRPLQRLGAHRHSDVLLGDGWSESWETWMNGGTGGAVCTRTLACSTSQGAWDLG